MRAERLLQLMFLLKAHGRMTARELGQRLGVSSRTVQRDLDALSLAGVPVYAERGRAGGWVLAPGYRTQLDGLTPAETAAVFVGTAGHVLADLGLAGDADRAYAKLLATIPAQARLEAEQARQRILVDHTGWRGAGRAGRWLEVIQQGLWQQHRVEITYAGRVRTVAPLGLVAKAQHWYLVAARDDGDIRTYRVSRVRHAALTEQAFARPAGFDLAAFWEQARERFFAGLRDLPVRLLVRDSVVPRLSWAPNVAIEQVTPTGEGWSQVRATFEKAYETRVYLLGLAGDIVVLEPAALREDMRAAARAFLAHHPSPSPSGHSPPSGPPSGLVG